MARACISTALDAKCPYTLELQFQRKWGCNLVSSSMRYTFLPGQLGSSLTSPCCCLSSMTALPSVSPYFATTISSVWGFSFELSNSYCSFSWLTEKTAFKCSKSPPAFTSCVTKSEGTAVSESDVNSFSLILGSKRLSRVGLFLMRFSKL